MRQLTSLDAQFLSVESPTTVGHVGSLVLLDPTTAASGEWSLDTVRAVLEPRLHLAAPFRQRLVPVPLGLGRPYWVDDPDFDLEFHLRELALPEPGTLEQLGEQVARIHARPLDRTRPLWEAYVITGVEDGQVALYTKVHHAAIDGVSGAEILATLMDLDPEPHEVEPEPVVSEPAPIPSVVSLLAGGLRSMATSPLEVLRTVPKSLGYLDELPGAGNVPAVRLVSEAAGAVARLLGQQVPVGGDSDVERRSLHAPHTPVNGRITPHRRFSFGSVPLDDVKRVKDHFNMTVNDVVMALTASALRHWLLDHDALPNVPLVVAVPVSVRADSDKGAGGNIVSVMTAELPTHLADAEERLVFVRGAMQEAKRHFDAVPATLLQDLARVIPTALSGLAARAIFRLATVPGVPFNLVISNVPGPQLPLYIAGAHVRGIYPVSAVTDLTGGLNITLFSYDGALDFGLIACREMVPDVWNLVGYLREALEEVVALVVPPEPRGTRGRTASARARGARAGGKKRSAP
jgi:diacylglycerol O-acyltransferase / wax synthase